MDASKENCRLAMKAFTGIPVEDVGKATNDQIDKDMKFLSEFLQAAERKLPSQASIDKDRTRNRKKVVK